MNLGAGIAVIAFGAVLAFAVNSSGGAIDVSVVGWIVMLAGLAYLLVEMNYFGPRRRGVARPTVLRRRAPRTVVVEDEPVESVRVIESTPETVVVEEPHRVVGSDTWYYDDPRLPNR
ncbi:DUF6458 family protein [Sporichthya polymorpha]|uniref:DUF6458 family protein n=1 Tax=Sporichthya polymorpha TaxID=35751 RepID=UPI0003716E26|nr:DUF6458 family protein [Sporichthya polymorpha]